jgi:hypothetical protein
LRGLAALIRDHVLDALWSFAGTRGFTWQARAKVKGLPVSGSDRWLDGAGAMRWKPLGLIPVVTAEGGDISRSALGRVQIEAMGLPTVLREGITIPAQLRFAWFFGSERLETEGEFVRVTVDHAKFR